MIVMLENWIKILTLGSNKSKSEISFFLYYQIFLGEGMLLKTNTLYSIDSYGDVLF
jgi:hypothetical protein